MNTILSIDLDILFSPNVGIYNKDIYDNKSTDFLWDCLSQQYNIWDFRINNNYLEYLRDILNNYVNQIEYIYIGYDHSSILTAIEQEKNNLLIPYKFNLYNIDYHHDIYYGNLEKDEIIHQKIANCGDWVGFLNYNKFIEKYYWYRGIGSDFNKEEMLSQDLVPLDMDRSVFDNTFPKNLKIDLLFIAISPHWIPPCYYSNIKNFLLELPQEKIKFLKYPFFVNGNRQKFLSLKGDKINDYFNF